MTAQSATAMRLFSDLSYGRKACILVGFAVLLRLVFFSGIGAADDVFVAQAALRVLEDGPYLPTSHYTGRLMLIYPLAAIFAVFGVGEWQMAILPLLGSFVALIVAGALARRYLGDRAALWTLLAGAIFPLDVYHATQMMPDAPIGGMLAAAIYCAFRSIDTDNRPWLWATCSGLLWGGAYLIKIEAAFLMFPMAAIYWMYGRNWKMALIAAASCGLIVVGENLIYWALTGDILYRLKVISESASVLMNEDYSARQLWVFPKAWFLTAYQFSLHYYLLFAAFGLALWKRERFLMVCLVWAGAFLLWLQFGANPFDDVIRFKSHLQRYCLMLAAPTFILVGYLLARLQACWPKAILAFGGVWLVGSVFLVTFNYLGTERSLASKQALAQWSFSKNAPVYMDPDSYTIGRFLYRGTDWATHFNKLIEHDYHTGKNRPVNPDTLDGYLMVNRISLEFAANRYAVKGFTAEGIGSHCTKVMAIDNPAYGASYFAAGVLGKVGQLIPVASVREKVSTTAHSLLEKGDVVIFACGSERR